MKCTETIIFSVFRKEYFFFFKKNHVYIKPSMDVYGNALLHSYQQALSLMDHQTKRKGKHFLISFYKLSQKAWSMIF